MEKERREMGNSEEVKKKKKQHCNKRIRGPKKRPVEDGGGRNVKEQT